ncbi:MAG: sulfate permease [Bacteroidia bacterium]
MKWKGWFPLLQDLRTYGLPALRGDLLAGLTVGVMLVPQGMAYALVAGLPPIYGLYASIFPLIVYGIFGTSRHLSVGPMALISLLVISGLQGLADPGSEAFIELALALSLLSGVAMVLLGLLRLGFLTNFLSNPVVSGFTLASALIIAAGQLKHLLGIQIARDDAIWAIAAGIASQVGQIRLLPLLVGVGSILLLLAMRRIDRRVPGALIVVALGIVLVWAAGWQADQLPVVGPVPAGLPSLRVPAFDLALLPHLLPGAASIALIGFVGSIAVAKTLQDKDRSQAIRPNQELLALGLANLIGAFFQAFPTTGGLSRSAVNQQAGARSGLASIFSAAVVALSLLFLTPLFPLLPKSVLAAIILVAIVKLIDWREALYLWRVRRDDAYMLLATFLATLLLGIEEGIFTGVVLSMGMVIFRSSYPHVAELGQVPGTQQYRNRRRFAEVVIRPEFLIVRPDAQLYFANVNYIHSRIGELLAERPQRPRCLVLDASAITSIDATALRALEDWLAEGKALGIEWAFASVIGPVRDTLHRAGFIDRAGKDCFFLHVHHAVEYFEARAAQPYAQRDRAVQSNTP